MPLGTQITMKFCAMGVALQSFIALQVHLITYTGVGGRASSVHCLFFSRLFFLSETLKFDPTHHSSFRKGSLSAQDAQVLVS